MGLFNGYLKEGPGIEKDAPKKKGIFLFFDVFFRKFFLLIKANFLYFLVSIPYLALAIFVLSSMVSRGLGLEKVALSLENGEQISVILNIAISLLLFNMFGSGPAGAGYAYVTRCFTRGEHTWVASDGFDKFKENFKNSLLLLVCDVIIIFIAMNALYFYSNFDAVSQGMMSILKYIIVLVFAIYMLAHIFAYQIMVTYECNFKALIKNSFILAMAKLPMCILLTAITGFICVMLTEYVGIISVFIYGVLGMSLCRFPLEFYAARVIEKNINTVSSNRSDEGAEQ